ncbi:MAG: hypothetical protein KBG28_08890 [Kofleriaceae bacterium]|nr:hypothetical protein [Kofleriaceae bacterium]
MTQARGPRARLGAVLAALLGAMTGCGGAGPTRPAPSVATPPAAVDARPATVAEPAPRPAPVDPAARRAADAAAALARLPEVQAKLAVLRQLAFKRPVPAAAQSVADFRKHIEAELPRELPPALAAATSTALAQLGVLRAPIDLAGAITDALATQAAAYYDSTAKAFYIVMVQGDPVTADTFNAHELVHALQDQHFDLGAYYQQQLPREQRTLSEDETNARMFVVEGDATFSMFAYQAAASGSDLLSPAARPFARTLFATVAAQTPDQLAEAAKVQAASATDEDSKRSAEALARIPLYLRVPLTSAYFKGALPIAVAYERGGWAEVATLYTRPPESTEQLLHPDTKLIGTRDLPATIVLPKIAGLSPVHGDVLGELLWQVYFWEWTKGGADAAAAGWDGDRYQVMRDGDGQLVGLMATTWDSVAEATEFEAAYRASLAARFPDGTPATATGLVARNRPDGSAVYLQRRGVDVFIADGARDSTVIGRLAKGTRITRR